LYLNVTMLGGDGDARSQNNIFGFERNRVVQYPMGGSTVGKDTSMPGKLVIFALCLVVAVPILAQKKEDERLADSATAMQAILGEGNGLPTHILD
jgi:hypothetical protein